MDGVTSKVQTQLSGKAPTNHASSSTTYGKGTTSNYGHLKISDNYTLSPSTLYNASNGVAVSLYSAQKLYEKISQLVEEEYTLKGYIRETGCPVNAGYKSPGFVTINQDTTGLFTRLGYTDGSATNVFLQPTSNATYYIKQQTVESSDSYSVPFYSVKNRTSYANRYQSNLNVLFGSNQKRIYCNQVNSTASLTSIEFAPISLGSDYPYYCYHISSITSGYKGSFMYFYEKS
jgi:hypothetical protein